MATLDDFTAAGLLDGAPTDRVALLEWLDSLGVDLDAIVDAASGAASLGSLASDRRILPGERLSRADALARTSMPPELFDAVCRAFGFVPVSDAPPGHLGLTSAEIGFLETLDGFGQIFSAEEALALGRVIGSAMARISDAMISTFLTDVETPHIESGGSEFQMATQAYEAVGLLDGFAERLDPVLRRHVLQAIETRRAATDGTGVRFAAGFVDLVGFTERSGGMSEAHLGAFLREFEARAYDVTTAAGARVVKLIGDEAMFVAPDVDAACRAALALTDAFDDAGHEVFPRGGLAYGPVVSRGGDYYGTVVNLASRLADQAVPQEVLVDAAVVEHATSTAFTAGGRRMVKGFSDPVDVWSIDRPHIG